MRGRRGLGLSNALTRPHGHPLPSAGDGSHRRPRESTRSSQPPPALDAHPRTELAERLSRLPLGLEPVEDRDQLGDDLVERDVVLELDVEPVADRAAAEEDRVGARAGLPVGVLLGRAADQADVGVVRAGRSRWGSRSSGR